MNETAPYDTQQGLLIRAAREDDLASVTCLVRARLGLAEPGVGSATKSHETDRFLEELSDPSSFFQLHYPARNYCWFWVAEFANGNHDLDDIIDRDGTTLNANQPILPILGWIGLQRKSADVGEICRFETRSDFWPIARNNTSVRHELMTQLISIARAEGVLQLFLGPSVVSDESIRTFCIQESGFSSLSQSDAASQSTALLESHRFVVYLGERIIRKVGIVGGTHGNERVGIELVRQWSDDQDGAAGDSSEAARRSTFSTQVLLGNPQASASNQRFVDRDLNRLFAIATPSASEPPLFPLLDSLDPSSSIVEISRAIELNRMLGPKGELHGAVGCDFIIDLHSSTSNVGLVAMVSACHEDPFALRVCHYLQNHFPDLKITTGAISKSVGWRIESIAPSGILFEVGPLAHGLVSSKLLEETRRLVLLTLDFVESTNLSLLRSEDYQVQSFSNKEAVFPRTSSLFSGSPKLKLEIYRSVGLYHYPTGPKFPTTAIISPSFEGQDWQPLSDGQLIFIDTSGSGCLIPFSYSYPDVLYPLFINEVAYQRYGIAFIMYRKDQIILPSH